MTNILQALSGKIQDAISDAGQAAEIYQMLDDYNAETKGRAYGMKPQDFASGRAILAAEPRKQIAICLLSCKRRRVSTSSNRSKTIDVTQSTLDARGIRTAS